MKQKRIEFDSKFALSSPHIRLIFAHFWPTLLPKKGKSIAVKQPEGQLEINQTHRWGGEGSGAGKRLLAGPPWGQNFLISPPPPPGARCDSYVVGYGACSPGSGACGGHGTCSGGRCQCEAGWACSDCSQKKAAIMAAEVVVLCGGGGAHPCVGLGILATVSTTFKSTHTGHASRKETTAGSPNLPIWVWRALLFCL